MKKCSILKEQNSTYSDKTEYKHTEKDYQNLQKTNWENCVNLGDKIEELEAQISSLKSQLADIKYLSRDEVEAIVNEKVDRYEVQEGVYRRELVLWDSAINEFITTICQYAIPKQKTLNRDEVEKILDKKIHSRYTVYGISEAVDAICKLAITEQKTINELSKELGMRDLTKEEAEIIDNHIEKLYKEDAIPDIKQKREKIIEILKDRFGVQVIMYLIEPCSATGKLTEKQQNDVRDYIRKSADQIIKALEGK